MILIMGFIIALYTVMRLQVSIDNSAIYYRFPPFIRVEKILTNLDIRTINVRKYRPIWEYGGYGFRVRFRSGKALNIAGKYGLQLVLSNGKRLLLGTQKPQELKQALVRLKESWSRIEDHE